MLRAKLFPIVLIFTAFFYSSVFAADSYSIKEYAVMNGAGTTKIGTRLEIIYPADTISDVDIIKIYNEKIANTTYNWITIRLNNGKGIKANSGSPILDFGTLDKLGRVQAVDKTGIIRNGKIEY